MGRSLTEEVVEAVAEDRGVDPVDLDFALYDYIDPTVLERLEQSGGSWTLTFELPDYDVTVTSDDRVLLDEAHRELPV
ncbi:MAG: HalOD1 output domain-containing protein [Haloferacaceae archaeon]